MLRYSVIHFSNGEAVNQVVECDAVILPTLETRMIAWCERIDNSFQPVLSVQSKNLVWYRLLDGREKVVDDRIEADE